MPLLKRIAVVYDSIIDYIHMTRIINKRTCRIFLTNRPVILKNPTEWFDSWFGIYYKYPAGYSDCIICRPGNANWWPYNLERPTGCFHTGLQTRYSNKHPTGCLKCPGGQKNIRPGIWNTWLSVLGKNTLQNVLFSHGKKQTFLIFYEYLWSKYSSEGKFLWNKYSNEGKSLLANTGNELSRKLKVQYCKFENPPIFLSSFENNMLKISH